MSLPLRIFLILISILFFVFVCFMVRREKLLLKYSIMWLILSVLGVVVSLFPSSIMWLSTLLGFESPVNLVFVAIIAILLIVCLMFSTTVTRQSTMIKDLVQELSIIKANLEGSDGVDRKKPERRFSSPEQLEQ